MQFAVNDSGQRRIDANVDPQFAAEFKRQQALAHGDQEFRTTIGK